MKSRLVLVGLALVIAACAGNPAPGEPGYSFNLNGGYTAELLGDDGVVYSGTVTLETLAGGEIAGTMDLTDPLGVSGEVQGLIVGSEASFNITFEIPDAGCSGIVAGTGIITEGGGSVEGLFDDITDDCGGAPTSLTFTLSLAG